MHAIGKAREAPAAQRIYKELGELTEPEMMDLYHCYTSVRRASYFRSIYGFAAGQVARAIYNRWARLHTCTTKCPDQVTVT